MISKNNNASLFIHKIKTEDISKNTNPVVTMRTVHVHKFRGLFAYNHIVLLRQTK